MDSSAKVKGKASRRHPEDLVNSDAESGIDSNTNIGLYTEYPDNEDFVIPGTGPKDMPLFKPSSKLSGSHQTVSSALRRFCRVDRLLLLSLPFLAAIRASLAPPPRRCFVPANGLLSCAGRERRHCRCDFV